jgi:diaminohydroxyphosphoribosylaminopyrimidine deaminase/5-amino-6-(5-phosphoribosylamino)uracil reductase
MTEDEHFMRKAIRLAKKGRGKVSPNPLVGTIIVKNGKIMGKGYHKKAGTDHAEVIAIKKAGKKAKGATMYVNLEPCCHFGKTPPCTDAIQKANIKRVVVAVKDPNPLVSGKGIKKMKKSGIEVNTGILKQEAKQLNEFYFTYTEKKRPFVILKIAQTIDGKIADKYGTSKWITNEQARKKVHSIRNEVDAILTGIGTVKKDDPEFTPRLVKKVKEPLRIVLDSNLNIPLKAKLIREGTIIATLPRQDSNKKRKLKNKNITIWETKGDKDGVSVNDVLRRAYREEILSILVEAGQKVTSTFLRKHLVDKVYIFVSNKILGSGITAFEEIGIKRLKDAPIIEDVSFKRFNHNFLIQGYVYRNH